MEKKRIPTLLALLILLLGIGGGIFFAEYSLNFLGRAEGSNAPKDVRITNLTDSLATISWRTDRPLSGAVFYRDKGTKKERMGLDEREKAGEGKSFRNHHVKLRDLRPQTEYEFRIISGGEQFDNAKNYYRFKTYKQGTLSELGPARGRVVNENGTPASGALIYLQLPEASPLSTLTDPVGEWLIPLNLAYNQKTEKPLGKEEIGEYNIFVVGAEGEQAHALADMGADFPLPNIALGGRYDFTGEAQLTKQEREVLGAGGMAETAQTGIIQPKDQQALPAERPLFRGKGIPGKKVSIIVRSELPQSGVVTVDERGNWFWAPEQPLSPGRHTVLIKTFDRDGNLVEQQREFSILKSGSRVLGEATPSATLAPTISPSPTQSPTLTPFPTLTPVFASPTPATATEPVAGDFTPVALLIGSGAFLLFLGLTDLPVYILRRRSP